MVGKFSVDCQLWSDHMPLNINFKLEFQDNYVENRCLLGKYKFNMSRVSSYKSELNMTANQLNSQNEVLLLLLLS